jgi:hypothetical protein
LPILNANRKVIIELREKRKGRSIMTARDPAAKEKAHAPTTPVPAKKGDELTTQELEGVVGGTVRDVATGLASGKKVSRKVGGDEGVVGIINPSDDRDGGVGE